MKNRFALLGGVIALSACTPLQKEVPPSFRTLGIGIIQDVRTEVRQDGENPEARAGAAVLAAGVIGMVGALATEDNLQQTKKWRYNVTVEGQSRSFLSHAVLKKGDCVEIRKIVDSPLSVLTRIANERCRMGR